MRKSGFLAVYVAFALMATGAASAAPIISRATGLVVPTTLIDFSEVALANDTPMSIQFAGLGVSNFTGLWYNGCPGCVTTPPDGAKPDLANFFNNDTGSGVDFSMTFAGPVGEAAFAFASNLGPTTFEAYLGATLVETFTVNLADISCNDTNGWCYYGFEGGGAFDRITVQMNGTAALIDNLQFVGVVPEPSAAVLYGVGLLVAGTALRRRTIAA
jgi:hypothetical protein